MRPDRTAWLVLALGSVWSAKIVVGDLPNGNFDSVWFLILIGASWIVALWTEIDYRRRAERPAGSEKD